MLRCGKWSQAENGFSFLPVLIRLLLCHGHHLEIYWRRTEKSFKFMMHVYLRRYFQHRKSIAPQNIELIYIGRRIYTAEEG